MTILIILLFLLIGFGFLTSYIFREVDSLILGLLSAFSTGFIALYFILHAVGVSTKEHAFNQWVVQREAFIQTLEDSRKNGREIEAAAIMQQISEWNKSLAENKYNNSTLLFGDYVDDRVETLQPIK